MTKFQLHVNRWKDCTACSLHETRTNVVFCRGSIPCDILFVGEAPGRSEDVVGQPFVGPAGHLINSIIEEAFAGLSLRYAMTNLVCCIPLDEGNSKLPQPDKDSIKSCAPRLDEFIALCRPKLIVRVGALSQKHVDFSPCCDIIHPAAILRKPAIQQHYDKKKCIITLRKAALSL